MLIITLFKQYWSKYWMKIIKESYIRLRGMQNVKSKTKTVFLFRIEYHRNYKTLRWQTHFTLMSCSNFGHLLIMDDVTKWYLNDGRMSQIIDVIAGTSFWCHVSCFQAVLQYIGSQHSKLKAFVILTLKWWRITSSA